MSQLLAELGQQQTVADELMILRATMPLPPPPPGWGRKYEDAFDAMLKNETLSHLLRRMLPISTLIFGLDSTLYNATTGLETDRRAQVVEFVVRWLQYPRWGGPEELLDSYVSRYSSEFMALYMAEALGEFPAGPWQSDEQYAQSLYVSDAHVWLNGSVYKAYSSWISQHVQFQRLAPVSTPLRGFLERCVASRAKLVLFSNEPR